MVARLLGTGATVGMGAGVPVGVGATVEATVAVVVGVGALAIVAVGAAVGKAFACTVGRIVSLGDCVCGFEFDVFAMRVGSKVGSDPGDPELLPQAVARKTKLSPITSLIDLIWPAVISDLFTMENVHSNLRVLF